MRDDGRLVELHEFNASPEGIDELARRYADALDENRELNDRLAALEQDRSRFDAELARLSAVVDERDETIKSLVVSITQGEAEKASTEQALDIVRSDLAELREAHIASLASLEESRAELAESNLAREAIEGSEARARSAHSEVALELERLSEAAAESHRASGERVAELTTSLNAAREALRSRECEREAEALGQSELAARSVDLQRRLALALGSFEAAVEARDRFAAEAGEQERRLVEALGRIESADQEREGLRRRVADLEPAVPKLAESERLRGELELRIGALGGELERALADLRRRDERLSAAGQAAEKRAQELAAASESAAAFEARSTALEAELNALRVRLARSESGLAEQTRLREELALRLSESTDAVAAGAEAIREHEQSAAELRLRSENGGRLAEALKLELAATAAQLAAFAEEIAELRSEAEHAGKAERRARDAEARRKREGEALSKKQESALRESESLRADLAKRLEAAESGLKRTEAERLRVADELASARAESRAELARAESRARRIEDAQSGSERTFRERETALRRELAETAGSLERSEREIERVQAELERSLELELRTREACSLRDRELADARQRLEEKDRLTLEQRGAFEARVLGLERDLDVERRGREEDRVRSSEAIAVQKREAEAELRRLRSTIRELESSVGAMQRGLQTPAAADSTVAPPPTVPAPSLDSALDVLGLKSRLEIIAGQLRVAQALNRGLRRLYEDRKSASGYRGLAELADDLMREAERETVALESQWLRWIGSRNGPARGEATGPLSAEHFQLRRRLELLTHQLASVRKTNEHLRVLLDEAPRSDSQILPVIAATPAGESPGRAGDWRG